ncbi:SMP-30/gluconolactonase/LRE family protein [Streptomyces sp. NPDC001665]
MTGGAPAVRWADRLGLGEGIRAVDGRVVLVDILAGRLLSGPAVPNGPAFTADGTVMYLAESAKGVIRRYPVDPESGLPGKPDTFASFGEGSPDGMAVDAEGGLWTAVWGTGTVHRYRADGTSDRRIRLPASQPAGVCLDKDTLYVTSARYGLTAPGPLDGAVFAVRVEVPGPPAAAYRQGIAA